MTDPSHVEPELTKAAIEIRQDPLFIELNEAFGKLRVCELHAFKTPQEVEAKVAELVRNPIRLRRFATQLRKCGKPYAALALLRSLPNEAAKDVYSIREAGWTLIACIKQTEILRRDCIGRDGRTGTKAGVSEESAQEVRDVGLYDQLLIRLTKELEMLVIPDDETLLLNNRAHYVVKYIGTERHLSDAFQSARAYYKSSPGDVTALKNYGWLLWDCLTQADDRLKDPRLVTLFRDEYLALRIPPEEEALHSAKERALKKADAFLSGCSEVRALAADGNITVAIERARQVLEKDDKNDAIRSELAYLLGKDGRHVEAIREWIHLLKKSPDNSTYQTSLAWDIIGRLKELADSGAAERDAETRLLNLIALFSFLAAIERPSSLFSLVLARVTSAFDAVLEKSGKVLAVKFLDFVRDWNLNNLRDEDFNRYEPVPGKSYPSLCEKVIRALYRALKVSEDEERSAWAADFIGNNLDRFPSQEWFPYYYGKTLLWANRTEEARKFLLKTVRLKQAEFWAWATLAETYHDDCEKEIACLCRSAQCQTQDESFLVNVHERLGELFRSFGMDSAARCEFRHADSIRQRKGWRAVTRNDSFSAWLSCGDTEQDNDRLYSKFSEHANGILLASLPSRKAVLERRFTSKENGEECANVGYQDEGGYSKVKFIRLMKFPVLRDLPHGSPLNIRVESVNGRPRVVSIDKRPDGVPWDIFPGRIAVITGVDSVRGRSFATFARGKSCVIDHSKVRESEFWMPGTLVEVKLHHDALRDLYHALHAYLIAAEYPSDFCKRYEGTLRTHEDGRFGFVGDVYVSQSLLSTLGTTQSNAVRGLAVVSFDRRKDDWGWAALTIGY